MKRSEIMQEIKTARDLVYEKERELSEYATMLNEQRKADLAYVAMMTDVDMDEDGDDDE